MLQSAIFVDLQVNNFGIPTVRLAPRLPLFDWVKVSFDQVAAWLGGAQRQIMPLPVSEHLRRDIGLVD